MDKDCVFTVHNWRFFQSICYLSSMIQSMFSIIEVSEYVFYYPSFSVCFLLSSFRVCFLLSKFQSMFSIIQVSEYVFYYPSFKVCFLLSKVQRMLYIIQVSKYVFNSCLRHNKFILHYKFRIRETNRFSVKSCLVVFVNLKSLLPTGQQWVRRKHETPVFERLILRHLVWGGPKCGQQTYLRHVLCFLKLLWGKQILVLNWPDSCLLEKLYL